jgi:CO/xanthine dehydrogenase Mo-binding subunit
VKKRKTKVLDKLDIFSPPALSPDVKSAKYQVINKPHPQIDALSKVTGKRKFLSDIRMQDMLWGQVLRSPHPHARIKKIDIRKALRVPGVRAVITAEDTPHNPCGPFIPDWEILPPEKGSLHTRLGDSTARKSHLCRASGCSGRRHGS